MSSFPMPSPSSSEYFMCWLSTDESDFPTPFFLCSGIGLIMHSVMQLVTAGSLMQFLFNTRSAKDRREGMRAGRRVLTGLGLTSFTNCSGPELSLTGG